jgi:predicted nucleotidyltransferase
MGCQSRRGSGERLRSGDGKRRWHACGGWRVAEATMKQIVKEVGELVKKEFNTEKVILFGSFASGEPSPGSDLDILVIMDTKLKPYKQSALIRMRLDEKLGVKVPIDLIVRTPQQINERLNLGDFFIKNILTKGVHL